MDRNPEEGAQQPAAQQPDHIDDEMQQLTPPPDDGLEEEMQQDGSEEGGSEEDPSGEEEYDLEEEEEEYSGYSSEQEFLQMFQEEDDQEQEEENDAVSVGEGPPVGMRVDWQFEEMAARDTNLLKNIKSLFNSPHMSDVTFLLFDTRLVMKPVFGHSFVLATSSPYFREMLYMTAKPCRMAITSIKYEHFINIMRLIYLGWDEKLIPLGEVDQYYRAIKELCLLNMFKWQIRAYLLKSVCEFHVDNISMIYTVGWVNHYDDLVKCCLREMEDYPKKIIEDRNFIKIPLDGIMAWIRRPNINAPRKVLKQVVERWINANSETTSDAAKATLRELVETTDYQPKGMMLKLQEKDDPGIALSHVSDDDEYTTDWAEQVVNLPMVVPDHVYQFSASFDFELEGNIVLYGLSMKFTKHKHHNERYTECYFDGEVTISQEGNYQLVWEKFSSSINFEDEPYVTVECFFIGTVIPIDKTHTVTVEWETEGAYPDIVTFETNQNFVKSDGHAFISSIWYRMLNND